MEREYRAYRHRPSFFWPITLITVGIVWLLVNNGTIDVENVYRLAPFWPVLLILAGLNLLVRRVWWPLDALVWAAAAAFVLWVLIAPPAFLPTVATPELKQETFSEPLGDAETASITLDLSGRPNRVFALQGSEDLFMAEIRYIGDIRFRSSGTREKTVQLDENRGTSSWGLDLIRGLEDEGRPWEIGLSPDVPLRLRMETGAGDSNIDLSQVQVESLSLNGGSGNMEVTLPESSRRFLFSYDGGSGRAEITVPEGASFELSMDTGSGGVVIDLPENVGVQLNLRNDGSGDLILPDDFSRTRNGDGNEGLWENEAYRTSGGQVLIVVEDQGSGNIEIR